MVTPGACVVAQGNWGGQGMHGCSGGHAWLLWGACVVALGGMCGCSGGMHGSSGGACVVALEGGVHGCFRGHAWLLPGGMHGCWGGMHGCSQGGHVWLVHGGVCTCSWGACMVARGACIAAPRGGMRGIRRNTEIRSMSGRYASYWNAFLFDKIFAKNCLKMKEIGLSLAIPLDQPMLCKNLMHS